jgi:hypothetical protein
VLFGKRVADVVLRSPEPLSMRRVPSRPPANDLYGESAIHALFGHSAGTYQKYAESGHWLIIAYGRQKRTAGLPFAAIFPRPETAGRT